MKVPAKNTLNKRPRESCGFAERFALAHGTQEQTIGKASLPRGHTPTPFPTNIDKPTLTNQHSQTLSERLFAQRHVLQRGIGSFAL
jgi:hypothetical protein